MENVTCPPLEVLNFLHYNKTNASEVNEIENQWPCELRIFWNSSPSLRVFAAVVQFLFNYGTIVLIITGLLVNSYSLLVLSSPPINKSNMSVYLKALAVSDMGALVSNIGLGVLRAKSPWISSVFINHRWLCTFHTLLVSLFFYYSTWLIVAFSFERLLMIRNPFNIHTWHNDKPARITVVVLAAVALVLAFLRSLTTGYEKDNLYGYVPCGAKDHLKISVNMVSVILINIIAPTILIISANVCLCLHVRSSKRTSNNLRVNSDQKNYLRVTQMMIIISVMYVVLYVPLGIVVCIDIYFRKHEPPTEDRVLHIAWVKNMMFLHWLRGLCFFLFLLNYVNNFFLYCLSGDIFRQALKTRLPSRLQSFCSSLSARNNASSQGLFNWPIQTPSAFQELDGNSTSSTEMKNSIKIPSPTGHNNAAFTNADEKDAGR